MRPIQATISASALRHNYSLAQRTASRSKVLAVVKANAYGHGLARVAKALGGVDGFGTIELDGAVGLRERGFAGPIVLLEGFFEENELPVIAGAGLAATVHCDDQIRMLEGAKADKPIDVYFKINTGMNRLGFPAATARKSFERLRQCAAVRSITLMTHFATSEAPDGIEEATKRFDAAMRGLALPRSLANSAAIYAHPGSHGDVVRLGIALYGATPFPDRSAEALGLRPAMTLTSKLIAIQDLAPGETIGYGATFRADQSMRIGVVACGYADGYPRHAPSGTPIVVGGVRTTTAGRASMDMITVDLGPVPGAQIGTPVVIWGEGMPIDEVATAAKTVGYELMCALSARVPVSEVA